MMTRAHVEGSRSSGQSSDARTLHLDQLIVFGCSDRKVDDIDALCPVVPWHVF